ncbi:MAG: substrate-binding domain-containing protein, partial [Betaproteobacteria bacterium]
VSRYLHGLGHRRFALLAGAATGAALWDDRRPALQRALSALPETSLIEAPVGNTGAVTEAVHRLLRQSAPPTAVVCTDDVNAAAAIDACTSVGAAVPNDVSVTGFGDTELARQWRPGLTTLRFALDEAGKHAAEQLLALISGRPFGATAFAARLIVRRSSGPPPAR